MHGIIWLLGPDDSQESGAGMGIREKTENAGAGIGIREKAENAGAGLQTCIIKEEKPARTHPESHESHEFYRSRGFYQSDESGKIHLGQKGNGCDDRRNIAMNSKLLKIYPLSEVIRGFKTFSARRINELRGIAGTPVWQRNYYERIIRNEEALQKIRRYIVNNPLKWERNRLYWINQDR